MNERNGSLREIKKNSLDRTGKYDYVFTEWTNFAKDLKKSRFLRNEQFLEQTFKDTLLFLLNDRAVRKRTKRHKINDTGRSQTMNERNEEKAERAHL